jgi:hypothetical protein
MEISWDQITDETGNFNLVKVLSDKTIFCGCTCKSCADGKHILCDDKLLKSTKCIVMIAQYSVKRIRAVKGNDIANHLFKPKDKVRSKRLRCAIVGCQRQRDNDMIKYIEGYSDPLLKPTFRCLTCQRYCLECKNVIACIRKQPSGFHVPYNDCKEHLLLK